MSAKAVIQGLEDSQLIKVFLNFVADFRLDYEKLKKEISYKCFEVTWVLPCAKATGYGRNENQAWKNGLKNLLELLMEDAAYVEYFSAALKSMKMMGESKDHPPPAKAQLKTEGHQPQYGKSSMNDDSYAKGQMNRPKHEVHHSKINLNRSMSQKGEMQIEDAKIKMKNLEIKLALVLQENKMLREKMASSEQKQPEQIQQSKGTLPKQYHPTAKRVSPQKSYKALPLGLGSKLSKLSIPKLNLQVLPNYHKKSQRCLNDVMLAAYNDRHGCQKVY